MTGAATSLDALAAGIEWPDADAAAAARSAVPATAGRLADVAEWLGATTGSWPPAPLGRPRLVLVGTEPDPAVTTLAESVGAGIRTIEPGDVTSAFATGTDAADAEIDAGTRLLVLAADGAGAALPVAVSLVTTAEPIALLPRGADAVDTAAWIDRAELVRDARRAAADLRRDPAALLERLGDATLAAATGFVLQTVLRRTPLVLDGVTAAVAGLLVADLASRAARWWQVADTVPDPVHERVVGEYDRPPLLSLGVTAPAGTAGLLTVPLLHAAIGVTGVRDGEGQLS